MEFKCSRGKLEWTITAFAWALLLSLTGFFSYQAWLHRGEGPTVAIPLGAAGLVFCSLLALIATLFYAPQKYEVTDEEIKVRRLGPDVSIRADSIRAIAALEKPDTGRVLRTCGVGGLYGYVGWFHGSKIGDFRAYMSRRRPLVLVTLKDGKKIALSPDAGEDFIESVRARFGLASV